MFLTFTWFTKLLCSLLCLLLFSALLSFIFFLLSIMRVAAVAQAEWIPAKIFVTQNCTNQHIEVKFLTDEGKGMEKEWSKLKFHWLSRGSKRDKYGGTSTFCHVLFELPTLETRENHSWEFLEWMVSLSFLETSRDNVFLLKDAFIEIVPEAQKLRAEC